MVEDPKRMWILTIPGIGAGLGLGLHFSNTLSWWASSLIGVMVALAMFALMCVIVFALNRYTYRQIGVPTRFVQVPFDRPFKIDTSYYDDPVQIGDTEVLVPKELYGN